MPDPEPGYRLKLRRAAEHLDAIGMEAADFAERGLRAPVPFEANPENEWTIFRRGTVQPPDPRWGTIVGDFIHNTRSALDNIVCAMILLNDPNGSLEDAAFPAYDGRRKWDADIVNRDRVVNGPAPTDGVTPEVLAAIEGSQPYHVQGSSRVRKRAPLLLLQTASNFDKHRTLHAASTQIAPRETFPGELYAVPPGYFRLRQARIAAPGTPIETGAEIGRAKLRIITPPPPDMEVGVYAYMAIDIRFSIPGKPFDVLHPELWAMISAAWRAVLRIEHAAGIDIASMPPPVEGWTWHPADASRDPFFG
jgi:hypothetical protein